MEETLGNVKQNTHISHHMFSAVGKNQNYVHDVLAKSLFQIIETFSFKVRKETGEGTKGR